MSYTRMHVNVQPRCRFGSGLSGFTCEINSAVMLEAVQPYDSRLCTGRSTKSEKGFSRRDSFLSQSRGTGDSGPILDHVVDVTCSRDMPLAFVGSNFGP